MGFAYPDVVHHFGAGVYAKEAVILAGQMLMQHAHKFDHLSILAQGTVELVIGDKTEVLHAPVCITIKAGVHHGVKCLSDAVWFCIHATDCTDVSNIDEILIAPIDNTQVNTVAQTLRKEN